MSILVISFLISLISTVLLVRYSHLHTRFSGDSDLSGVQKFHVLIVPRVGGISILLGVFSALSLMYAKNTDVGSFGLLLIGSSLPAFAAGLCEDLTKKVGVRIRLLATVGAAGIAGSLLNAWLSSVQILGIDNLMLTYPFFAILITCFAVAGVSNAFNIIDGYNGLSSMVALIILLGISYVAFQVNDYPIMIAAFAMVGALLGFGFLNYPRGLIFLGDGGAYFIGFWIAELSVLLTSRHSEVSKWFPLLLCFYPIFETIFSIYRRVVLKGVHPGMPDATHLHQLIFKRLVRWSVGSDSAKNVIQRNSLTSPYLWVLSLIAVIPAVLFWQHHMLLKLFCVFFALVYLWLYWSIVRFKAPLFLILENNTFDTPNRSG
jgi:UDP-N-acetylmuramyl pentapeptide phosphotransferase/UDP-N-acetylglucosamine-1-phosphate transferase